MNSNWKLLAQLDEELREYDERSIQISLKSYTFLAELKKRREEERSLLEMIWDYFTEE